MSETMPAAPTYHRQRLLLFLVEQAGGRLSKMDLQKLLFLYMKESGGSHYDFVPYHYGCYSFQANDDLELLSKRNWIALDGHDWVLQCGLAGQKWAFQSEDRQQLRRWLARNSLRGRNLIREVYQRYPYYAINSHMKDRLLDDVSLARVAASLPREDPGETLFTVGYEGISFEEYANKLISNGIRLLCDVRRNPLSRKFGFSRGALERHLPGMKIAYEHLPELGIPSENRQNLDAEGARENLFEDYARQLPSQGAALDRVLALLREHGRIALTCFESEPHQCHRHCVSDHLAKRHGIGVRHL